MAVDMAALVEDLSEESAALDAILAGLDETQWALPSPAAGWSIGDQVSHLAYFDDAALSSIVDPDRFRADAAALADSGADFPDRVAQRFRGMSGASLLTWMRLSRAALLGAYAILEPGHRLPWYGPDMSAASSVTARLMETWAHGQDILDALGISREPTHRLRHVAHLGVGTRGFSYALHGRTAPDAPIRVELTAPDASTWTWGPEGAADRVSGSALDFCLLVTQRRHRDDTDVTVVGDAAIEWMSIAQAFAGAPGPGRAPSGNRS